MSATTDAIDAMLSAMWPQLAAAQDAFCSEHGVFFQLLWTHAAPPAGDLPPDAAAPAGQPAYDGAWIPQLMRARVKVDTYGQPDGWTLTAEAEIDGEVWYRSADCGTDESRSAAWCVKPAPAP